MIYIEIHTSNVTTKVDIQFSGNVVIKNASTPAYPICDVDMRMYTYIKAYSILDTTLVHTTYTLNK